jgi:hypothetical protein
MSSHIPAQFSYFAEPGTDHNGIKSSFNHSPIAVFDSSDLHHHQELESGSISDGNDFFMNQ